MTDGTTTLRRDAADNHRRLLEAAVAEFNEQGMDVPVEQISARAGVGVGTFYRRFGTKEALIDHLVEEMLLSMLASAEQALAHGGGDGLEEFMRATATSLAAHRGYLPRLWSHNKEHGSRLRPLMVELLTTAKAQGAIRSEVTANDMSVLLWSLRSIIEISGPAADVAGQRHLDFALAGMRPSAEPPRHPPLSDRAWARAQHRMARP